METDSFQLKSGKTFWRKDSGAGPGRLEMIWTYRRMKEDPTVCVSTGSSKGFQSQNRGCQEGPRGEGAGKDKLKGGG